ncbi:ankyrin repeat domain-containing protein, partial [Escherichia coli]
GGGGGGGGGGGWGGGEEGIGGWVIRNNFLIDLTKISDDKNHDHILKYKTSYEQKEISRNLKHAKNKIANVKNGGRL